MLPDNWRKVDQLERRYMGAAMRHLNAFRQGETLDAASPGARNVLFGVQH